MKIHGNIPLTELLRGKKSFYDNDKIVVSIADRLLAIRNSYGNSLAIKYNSPAWLGIVLLRLGVRLVIVLLRF